MAALTYPDFREKPTLHESNVRSTALAYRFMMRRSLGARGGVRFQERAAPESDAMSIAAPLQRRRPT